MWTELAASYRLPHRVHPAPLATECHAAKVRCSADRKKSPYRAHLLLRKAGPAEKWPPDCSCPVPEHGSEKPRPSQASSAGFECRIGPGIEREIPDCA